MPAKMNSNKLISQQTRLFIDALHKLYNVFFESQTFSDPQFEPDVSLTEDSYHVVKEILKRDIIPEIAEREGIDDNTVRDKLTRKAGFESIDDFVKSAVDFFIRGDNRLVELALRNLPDERNREIGDNDQEYLTDYFQAIRDYKEGRIDLDTLFSLI